MGGSEWLGIALFIVGIPVAWWLGRKNRQRPNVRFGIDEEELVRADDALSRGGLEIRFRDQIVERVCRSYFSLWLKSGDPISGRALPETDPLGVDLTDGDRVLSARVVTESRKQINVIAAVDASQRGVDISFEFLDAGDGFVVEILHEIHSEPRMRGSIPGANVVSLSGIDLSPKGRSLVRKPWWGRFRERTRLLPTLVMLVLIGVVLFMTVIGYLDAFGLPWRASLGMKIDKPPEFNGWLIGLYSMTLMFVIFISWDIFRKFRRRIPRSVVAQDYEAAFEWAPEPRHYDSKGRSYLVGDMIRHSEYGVGVIDQLKGEGAKLILFVTFKKIGLRKLLASLAPIELLAEASETISAETKAR